MNNSDLLLKIGMFRASLTMYGSHQILALFMTFDDDIKQLNENKKTFIDVQASYGKIIEVIRNELGIPEND